MIDIEDIENVKKYTWWYGRTNGYVYAETHGEKSIKRVVLHRFLLDVYDKEILVDHINRNRLDNRKSNLRKTSPTGNSINRNKQSNNKSGVIGVSWNKLNQKWEVRIKLHGKKFTVGYFTDLEEATKMRLQAELDIFGDEYAPQRDLFNKYNIHIRNRNRFEYTYK